VAVTERHEPDGLTIASGAYVVRTRLQGDGSQQLWLATHVATGSLAVAAVDYQFSRNTVEMVRARVEPDGDGVPLLDYIGPLDPNDNPDYRSYWALVERAPGTWLPNIVTPHDPQLAVGVAAGLGESAAAILKSLCARGPVPTVIRPELMWAMRDRERAVVTAVSTRAPGLFSLSREDAATYPVFATRYEAPELRAGASATPSAAVYSLGLMVAEWATGQGYAKAIYRDYGRQPRDLALAMELPAALESAIRAAIDPDPANRPSLTQFGDELARFA
jgi:hypothetical protein